MYYHLAARLFKNHILYILSSGSVIINTHFPSPPFGDIFICVYCLIDDRSPV